MEERIARLKTSQDAQKLAENARRLGHPELEANALQRASELKALEDGYTSPAQQAIAAALYAYEEQQSQLKGRTFRANSPQRLLMEVNTMAIKPMPAKYTETIRPSKEKTSLALIASTYSGQMCPRK